MLQESCSIGCEVQIGFQRHLQRRELLNSVLETYLSTRLRRTGSSCSCREPGSLRILILALADTVHLPMIRAIGSLRIGDIGVDGLLTGNSCICIVLCSQDPTQGPARSTVGGLTGEKLQARAQTLGVRGWKLF